MRILALALMQIYFSVPPVDAPELARRGSYSVGVRTLDLVNPGQPDILNFNKETGKAPLYDRPLKVEIWYPAVIPEGAKEHTVYTSPMAGRPDRIPASAPKTFQVLGKALRDAIPVKGERFPLVVVSHGYPGSRTFLSYLTENLASKGYVVAAIDHTDSVFGDVKGFASTLLNRSNDQLFTIDALGAKSSEPGNFLYGLVDASRVAIVGYSMGGYGALASAGAGYSAQGGAAKMVPGGYMGPLTAANSKFAARRHANLKALVAISPWGAQPPQDNWDEQGLAGIRIPSLFVVGDHDDVSGYDLGVKKAFNGTVHSERCMLVYQNANHNVGGNPPPDEALADLTTREFFDEPVWRKDRIGAINQHFITAFLDLYLKGDESRRSYIHVAVEKSNDGVWPATYWKGFQLRWAMGMEMHCAAAQ